MIHDGKLRGSHLRLPFRPSLGVQMLGNFQLQGLCPDPPDQGLSPWATLGVLPRDPHYRLVLCVRHVS